MDEYTETRNDTLDQLQEFSESLSRMKEGNLSLVDDLNRIQLVNSSHCSAQHRNTHQLANITKHRVSLLATSLTGDIVDLVAW